MASDLAKRSMVRFLARGTAEPVTYVHGAVELAINAIVDRGAPADSPPGTRDLVKVCVLNDAALGISSASMNVKADKIKIPPRVGTTAEAMNIARLLGHDSDWIDMEMA